MRSLRQFSTFFFWTKRFRTHQKAQKGQKAPKAQNTTKKKHKNAKKRTKIKNVLKKHLRRKKSFIHLFAFLCLRNKKKRVSTMEMLVRLN